MIRIVKINEVKVEGNLAVNINNRTHFFDKMLLYDNNIEKIKTREEMLNYNGYYALMLYDLRSKENVILIKELSNVYKAGVIVYDNMIDELMENMEKHILESIDNKALKSIKKQIADIIHYKVLWKIKCKTSKETGADNEK